MEEKKKPEISFSQCEGIYVFNFAGNFIHNLEYIDDPLFLEGCSATMEVGVQDMFPDTVDIDVPEIKAVKKIPASLSGYLLYDKDDNVIGFSCFNSQINFRNCC